MADPRQPSVFTPSELLALTLEPNWADVEPRDRRVLLVDLGDEQPLADRDLATLQRWLVTQVVPVIGVGEDHTSPLHDSVDLVVAGAAELQRAVRNVLRNPVAAAVLVHVLRSVESLDVARALSLESLAFAALQGGREFADWLTTYRTEHPERRASASDDMLLLNRHGGHLQIVLNSPDTRNAICVPMRDALTEAFKLVALDASIVWVEVSANGPCFSSGGELGEFGTLPDPAQAHMIRMLRMPAHYLAPHAKRYSVHAHRACIGAGIELAAFAGCVTASASTFFQLPELNMGLIPGAGGCVSISRRIGRQRTAYMVMLGKKISAQRALAWGLIDAIVD